VRSLRGGRLSYWVCVLCVGALGVGVVIGWCSVASAQDRQRVLVLEPAAPTSLEYELLTRLSGELGAAGMEVIRMPLAPGSDPASAVVTQGIELGPVAAFATKEDPAQDGSANARSTLRLWLSDRVTGTLLVEDGQEREGSLVASSLAVQGFELLQARVADWQWRRSAPPLPEPPPPVAPPPPPPRDAELTVVLYAGLLYDAPSGGAALTPMARVAYAPGLARGVADAVDLHARLSVAGFGAATVLDASERQVDVVQSFALLEGVVTLDSGGWLRPYASAGAGAYRVEVSGISAGAVVGRAEDTLSPLGGAGLGLLAQPFSHWVAQVEAQGLFAISPTAIDIGATRAATLGRPLLILSIGVGVAL
jgi:hypothetical protein